MTESKTTYIQEMAIKKLSEQAQELNMGYPKLTKCNSFLGHNFQPRYDIKPPDSIHDFSGGVYAFQSLVESLTKKTYVRDVCTRCGQTIERDKP